MRVGSVRAQRRTASVPAEMMKFISHVWHIDTADDLAILIRFVVNVYHDQSVGFAISVRIQSCHIRELLGWSLDRKFGGGIKRRVGLPQHERTS
jgi:hypothetical protein